LSLDELTAALEAFHGRDGLRAGAAISAEKLQTLADFWPLVGFIYDGPTPDAAAHERWLGEAGRAVLAEVRDALASLDPFTGETIEAALTEIVARRGVKPGEIYQPLRVALAGRAVSPGIF